MTHMILSAGSAATAIRDRSGFRSFKTVGAIPYPARWHRDLLVQATLDPAIGSIRPVPATTAHGFGLLVDVAGSETPVLAVRDEHALLLACEGAIVVRRSYVMAEPRCSTARMIWSTRRIAVAPGTRVRIISKLREQPHGVPIGSVSDALAGSVSEPIEAILALVCAGQAEIDIRQPFSPDTMVRTRSIPVQTRCPSLASQIASRTKEVA